MQSSSASRWVCRTVASARSQSAAHAKRYASAHRGAGADQVGAVSRGGAFVVVRRRLEGGSERGRKIGTESIGAEERAGVDTSAAARAVRRGGRVVALVRFRADDERTRIDDAKVVHAKVLH